MIAMAEGKKKACVWMDSATASDVVESTGVFIRNLTG